MFYKNNKKNMKLTRQCSYEHKVCPVISIVYREGDSDRSRDHSTPGGRLPMSGP